MKRVLFVALAAGALSATAAFAQPPEGGPPRGPGAGDRGPGDRGPGDRGPGGPGGPGRMPPSPVIAALDTDKDGTISAEEIENAVASLKTLDKNEDGKLTAEELRPQGGPGGPGGPGGGPGAGFNPDAMLERVFAGDANGDGKLSKEEAPERMQPNFDRLDADSDGFVTKDEMRAAFERMREGGFRGPRDGEGGPPRGPRDGEGGPRGPRDGEGAPGRGDSDL